MRSSIGPTFAIVGSLIGMITVALAYNNLGVIEIARGVDKESDFDYHEGKTHWEKAMSFFYKAIGLDPFNSNAQGNINKFKDAY